MGPAIGWCIVRNGHKVKKWCDMFCEKAALSLVIVRFAERHYDGESHKETFSFNLYLGTFTDREKKRKKGLGSKRQLHVFFREKMC